MPEKESAGWVEVSEMLAELNLDTDCIVASLAGLLLEQGLVGLDTAREHLGDEALTLLDGLLRFDELRSIGRRMPRRPAGMRGPNACASCCSRSSTTFES